MTNSKVSSVPWWCCGGPLAFYFVLAFCVSMVMVFLRFSAGLAIPTWIWVLHWSLWAWAVIAFATSMGYISEEMNRMYGMK